MSKAKLSVFCTLVLTAVVGCMRMEELPPVELDGEISSIVCRIDKVYSDQNYDVSLANPSMAMTKAEFSGEEFHWSEGDKVGIVPDKGAQVYFTIDEGAGTSTAVFDGGAWALKTDASYWSYFPLDADMFLQKENIPVHYGPQLQSGNANRAGCADYWFLYTDATSAVKNAENKWELTFNYHHLTCFFKTYATVPAGNYTRITFSTDEPIFISEGYVDISENKPTISGTEFTNEIILDLEDVSFEEDTELVGYAVVAPVDINGVPISVTIYRDSIPEYKYTVVKNANMVAPMTYAFRATTLDKLVSTAEDANNEFANGATTVEFSEAPEEDICLVLPATTDSTSIIFPNVTSDHSITVTYSDDDQAPEPEQIFIKAPEESDICLETPNSTVTLGAGSYNTIKSSTATNTLIIPEDVSIRTLDVRKGSVTVYGHVDLIITDDMEYRSDAVITIYGTVDSISGEDDDLRVEYPNIPDHTNGELFFYAESETSVTLTSQGTPDPVTIEYLPLGGKWTEYNIGTEVHLAAGDSVAFRSGKGGNKTFSKDSGNYYKFIIENGRVYAFGSVMSLIDRDMETSVIPSDYCFAYLFSGCSGLVQAPELPADELKSYCYQSMFSNCTGLECAPELPAETLKPYCYRYMFRYCGGLVDAPKLPATTLAQACYQAMFAQCIGLKSAPELPAETMQQMCYYIMFNGCTSLENAPELPSRELANSCYNSMFGACKSLAVAPALPATKLENSCYYSMFAGCTSLTETPELNALTLADQCYGRMFWGCENLNYIKMLATDVSARNCLQDWVSGVPSEGVFVKNSESDWFVQGASGIPEGWYIDYTESEMKMVDLGLSVKWASHNLGAKSPYQAGDFYAWGETSPKEIYTRDNYTLTRLPATLSSTQDAATVNLGSDWRMPSSEEIQELVDNCKCVQLPDTSAWIVYGPNGNYIVLPLGGHRNDGQDYGDDLKNTYYWSNTNGIYGPNTLNMWFELGSDDPCQGRLIRPVSNVAMGFEFKHQTIYLEPGDSKALVLVAENGTEYCGDNLRYMGASWTSSAPGVASVDSAGVVHAISNGTTTLTATSKNGATASCSVNVSTFSMSPVTFNVDGGNTSFYIGTSEKDPAASFEYMVDDGDRLWNDYVMGEEIIVPSGSSISFRASDEGNSRLSNDKDSYTFKYSFKYPEEPSFSVYGNILSLLNKKHETIPPAYCFRNLFCESSELVSAEGLELPTNLSEGIFSEMFSFCGSLTAAPELPAEKLAESCYASMFQGCKSLIEAPVLPAKTLANKCYAHMFEECDSLSYVKALFTAIPQSSGATDEWLNGVASEGVFVKGAGATWTDSGASGVPVGWIIESDALSLNQESITLPIGESTTLSLTNSNAASSDIAWTSANPSIASVSSTGVVTGVSTGNTTITATAAGKTVDCNVTVGDFVDLGLSVLWGRKNLGAASISEQGSKYAWGEKTSKATFDWTSYKYCNGSMNSLTKYCSDSSYGNNSYTDNLTRLEPSDDVVTGMYGEGWCMPTREMWRELVDSCTFSVVNIEGKDVVKVESNVSGYTDKYIILPAFDGAENLDGYYWTSDLNSDSPFKSYYLYFFLNNSNLSVHTDSNWWRSAGYLIRPVYNSVVMNQ